MNSFLSLILGSTVFSAKAPFTSLAADGWQTTVAAPVDLSFAPFPVGYQGYDANGNAVTHTVTRFLTKRVRNVFPNQATFTADQVAANDYIYQGAVIPGAVNNSTVVSPKPIATWGMVDRLLVGNSIAWEIIPFHRDARLGRQVACVRVRATDGTNTTAWQTVSTTSLSTTCEAPMSVESYSGVLDITSLNDNATITLQGQVMPWFGQSASILDSTTETEFRFSNRFFFKNTTRVAAPNLIYVASTGNDTTGVVSTNPVTAKATPALTVGGAINRLRLALGSASANALSGAEVRIVDGVGMGSVPGGGSYFMDGAAIRVTRDPDVTRATANITWATGNSVRFHSTTNPGAVATESAIIFDDVTITRTADVTFQGEAARRMHVQLRNVNMNFSSVGAATGMMSNSFVSIFGMTVSNFISGLAFTTAGDQRILRGLTGSFNNASLFGYNVIACSVTAGRIVNTQSQRGALIYNNNIPDPAGAGTASILITSAASGQSIFAAVVQNLVPMLKTGAQINVRISGDSDNGNIAHLVMHHNTTPGDDTQGRWNLAYDETAATARTHILVSSKGNLGAQLNTKGDVFMTNGARIGNFAFVHGVGCAGNFTEDIAPTGLSFNQSYGGIGSVIAGGDPLYVDDRAVIAPSTAGSLGGNYRLQAGSPARDLFSEYLLAFDIEGTLRPTSGTVDAGSYA